MRDLLSPSHLAGRLAGFSTRIAAIARSASAGLATAGAHLSGLSTDVCFAWPPCPSIPPGARWICVGGAVRQKSIVGASIGKDFRSASFVLPELDRSGLLCTDAGD